MVETRGIALPLAAVRRHDATAPSLADVRRHDADLSSRRGGLVTFTTNNSLKLEQFMVIYNDPICSNNVNIN